jgi:hypothetical protein
MENVAATGGITAGIIAVVLIVFRIVKHHYNKSKCVAGADKVVIELSHQSIKVAPEAIPAPASPV